MRRALEWLPAGNGRRYSAEMKAAIRRAAEKQRLKGASWSAIATALRMPMETVRRFVADGAGSDDGFVAIEVAGAASKVGGLTLTTASGERIEGLDVGIAAELVRRLR